jgi:hypothetical protein
LFGSIVIPVVTEMDVAAQRVVVMTCSTDIMMTFRLIQVVPWPTQASERRYVVQPEPATGPVWPVLVTRSEVSYSRAHGKLGTVRTDSESSRAL